MTDQEHVSLGEVKRALARIEAGQQAQAEQLRQVLIPLGVLQSEMADLKPKVNQLWRDAALISGGIYVGVWALSKWLH